MFCRDQHTIEIKIRIKNLISLIKIIDLKEQLGIVRETFHFLFFPLKQLDCDEEKKMLEKKSLAFLCKKPRANIKPGNN